jgi:hypothetical protein
MFLRQSTAVEVPVGPFLDSTDGNTTETGLTITQPDIRLKKNGAAWAQKSAAQTLSHEEAGWYEAALSATDTDTVGHLILAVHESGALPVWFRFFVVPKIRYDVMTGAFHFSGAAQAGAETTITLATTASAEDDYYNDQCVVRITSGEGRGQERLITDYVGSTKVATVATWTITPNSTSRYALIPAA